MKKLITTILLLSSYLSIAQNSWILINNVQIFNGKDEKTIMGGVVYKNTIGK